jgi:xanthine dehydrogenase accessory factor
VEAGPAFRRWRATGVFWQRPGMSADSRTVLHALAAGEDPGACLAVVLETEGSTYAHAGALALFGGVRGQVGWLSGGCLEPGIAARAAQAVASGRIDALELDTRADEDLLDASAIGCRGRLRLALLPLDRLPGLGAAVREHLDARTGLVLSIAPPGRVELQVGVQRHRWELAGTLPPWRGDGPWELRYAPTPVVVVFGAGPESGYLLPALHALGWDTWLVERRDRWRGFGAQATRHFAQTPAEALRDAELARARAALVMHHHFELDREALDALAPGAIGFVGLLGPRRRRDDLFTLLAPPAREALMPRLRSPVGLALGGEGAAAIALSIAAQLQTWRHDG